MIACLRPSAQMVSWPRPLFGRSAALQTGFARARGLVAAAALGMALAGCQATNTEDVLDVAPQLPVPVQETLGGGPVMIAMLLPRSATEPAAAHSRDFVDGARLAVNELGGGQIRVTVYDTAGRPENAGSMAEQAIAAGARLIVAYDAVGIATTAKTKGARPPVLALSGEGNPAGVFAFSSDSIDSAIDGARAAITAKQSSILALVPEGFAQADRERFARGVARHGGKLVGTIDYPAADIQVGPALKAQQPLFLKATTVVIFGSGRAPAVVAQSIAAQGLGGTITTLVGNSAWPRELYTIPVLDGVLIAMPDQDSLKQIAGRFQAAAGRPLSLEAAIAYDAVAIAAGLVRTNGAAGLTVKALVSDAGFRGASGLFRFRKDGSVERRHAIHRIEKGRLVLLQNETGGF
jgi:ABC-type branched-subunit amino acid transport system substrate-binding protein